jgi:hypothetical protein
MMPADFYFAPRPGAICFTPGRHRCIKRSSGEPKPESHDKVESSTDRQGGEEDATRNAQHSGGDRAQIHWPNNNTQ